MRKKIRPYVIEERSEQTTARSPARGYKEPCVWSIEVDVPIMAAGEVCGGMVRDGRVVYRLKSQETLVAARRTAPGRVRPLVQTVRLC